MDQLCALATAQALGSRHWYPPVRREMIQELVEVWAWFFGMIAGWGATTIGIVVALVVLWIKHRRLRQRVEGLYNRLVANERDWSIWHNRDKR